MTWIDIGPIDAIPLRGARKIKTVEGCVAVFRTGKAEVFATSNTCPHKGGPLAEGIVHGTSVTCPLHNMVFDLETGRARAEDATVETFPCEVREGRILIDGTRLTARNAA